MSTKSIRLHTIGSLPEGVREHILEILEGCYQSMGYPEPWVEVRVVDTLENLKILWDADRLRAGVTESPEEGFLSFYDAWEDFPRITLCWQKLAPLEKLLREGVLRHEAAHSLLHNRLEYYKFSLPTEITTSARQRGFTRDILRATLYLVSIAVKDMEATALLVHHGFLDCQEALALYQLQVEEEEIAWQMIKGQPVGRMLYFAAQLKPILFSLPLINHLPSPQQLRSQLQALTDHLPHAYRRQLLDLAKKIESQPNQPTHQKIDHTLRLLFSTF